MTFRSKIFLTALAAAAMAVLVASALVSWSVRRSLERRIERELANEARMAAEILSHRTAATELELDGEADTIGQILGARVTFIAADGRVVGDSDLTAEQLRGVENHGDRPEIVEARQQGIGAAQRHSTTVQTDMMYVAIPVRNAGMPLLAFVRLALPLTDVDRQLASVRSLAALGFVIGIAAAVILTWVFSAPLSWRLRSIDERARRYAAGNFAPTVPDYAQDEIGTVARMLDTLTRDLAGRLAGLEADRARMAAILSGMIEGVLVVNEHGRLQLANEAARRMLQIDAAVEGRHYPEIVRQPAVAQQIAAALAGRSTESVELSGLRDDNMILIARTAPVEISPGRGAVVVLHDITDLRRADRIRRDFVANVSHELRTPLTAIRGYVEALADATPEEGRRFLEIVSRHTMRMERLVRDLLRLARLDAGQEILERVPCSVDSLFNSVEGDLAALLETRDVCVERRVAPDATTVKGDPAKLQDALRNLLENAANHAPDGTCIVMQSRRQGGRILISVMDEGPGIPPSDLSRVFERFYRVDKSRTREGKDPGGTGLGLSIVRHLVELHGGRVSAANRAEHGAVFTIDLPA
ncbi:MAG TPA: ATP-binding protein [Vicinamibacterales bacterium]|nr:ATP-binding protein [Vicinamibacterales bacterium]